MPKSSIAPLPPCSSMACQAGVAARDLLGDQREGAQLGRGIERHAAEFLGHAEGTDADAVGLLEDRARHAGVRVHQPLALPVAPDERRDEALDEFATARAHQALLFGQTALDHFHAVPLFRL